MWIAAFRSEATRKPTTGRPARATHDTISTARADLEAPVLRGPRLPGHVPVELQRHQELQVHPDTAVERLDGPGLFLASDGWRPRGSRPARACLVVTAGLMRGPWNQPESPGTEPEDGSAPGRGHDPAPGTRSVPKQRHDLPGEKPRAIPQAERVGAMSRSGATLPMRPVSTATCW